MSLKTIFVTGSSGLIGSEAVEHFDRQGHQVHGIDNNMRAVYFGDQAIPLGTSSVYVAPQKTLRTTISTFATALRSKLFSAPVHSI